MSLQNICNICGANYEYRNGRWVCPACGAYKAEELSNEEVTLLYNAAQKLRLADFDEAEIEYNDIVQKYPLNAEAYWGRLLSKYGIKYEEDFDGKKIPTCYATAIESVIKDKDYEKALAFADPETREYYTRQAEYIERVRKEWVEKASHEQPYDVFICYKDSDLGNGVERTQDSIAAQELYIHLMEQGYRVFFSRESLRDKVGEKYEPYIFNALSTAKVMLVYGTNADYINSTWLKNEWTRYHKRIQAGEKKPGSLVAICDGFSPNELPRLLASTQCFDATKRSFYSDLDKYVKKYAKEEEPVVAPPPPQPTEEAKPAEAAQASVEKPKKRGAVVAVAVVAVALVALLIFLIPNLGGSSPTPENSFEIQEGSGGMMSISGYQGEDNHVVIPSSVNGGTVVGIEARAFDSMDNLLSVTIPDTVTYIGASAFYGCTSIDVIHIPASVTKIGTSAFYGWTSSQTIILDGRAEVPSEWNTQWNAACEAKIVCGSMTIRFHANGGDGSMSDMIVNTNDQIRIDECHFERPGYNFMGWSYSKSGGVDIPHGEIFNTGEESVLTLFAVWEPNNYKVYFNADGGTGSMEPQVIACGRSALLSANKFSREGYVFVHWSTADGTVYTENGRFTMGPQDVTLYAVWNPADIKVTLTANGGNGSDRVLTTLADSSVSLPESIPFTRPGYTLVGWTDTPDGEFKYPVQGEINVGTKNITLYAFWEPNENKVVLNANGGTIELNGEKKDETSLKALTGETVTLPQLTLTRPNYVFAGWSKLQTGSVAYQNGGSYTASAADVQTLYAIWLGEDHILTFDPNGGDGTMEEQHIRYGETAKINDCTFTKEGCMLAGWATSPNGEPVYAPGGDYQMAESTTLYAIWKETEHPITYVLGNGGVNHEQNPAFYLKSGETVTLLDPTRPGYTFLGWYTDEALTTPSNTIPGGSEGEKTFYAAWKANTNTLHFNAGNGSGSMQSITAKTDESITLPTVQFQKEDYIFAGWATSPLGKVEYTDGASFTMPADEEFTLYAVFKPQSFTITYEMNGGTLANAHIEYDATTMTFSLGTPVRPGYTFAGWSGTDLDGIVMSVLVVQGSHGDRSYTAHWTPKETLILFESNIDGVNVPAAQLTALTGDVIKLLANPFTVQGYVFKGWQTTTEDGSMSVIYDAGADYTVGTPDTICFYAVWELKNPELTFSGNELIGYTGNATVVEIPEYYNGVRITSIGTNAFAKNTSVQKIWIPDSVSRIRDDAFSGCTNLAEFIYNGTGYQIARTAFEDTAYYNDAKNWKDNIFYFEGILIGPRDPSLVSGDLIIPDGTRAIVNQAFDGCTGLRTVFIPGSVTRIGTLAFMSCSDSLVIRCQAEKQPSGWQASWNSTGYQVIWNYSESYTDENGVTYLLYPNGTALVSGYNGRKASLQFQVPGYTITEIAAGVFQGNEFLVSVQLPEGLTKIGSRAFSSCVNLQTVAFPKSLTEIASSAFSGCTILSGIELPESLNKIGSSAFSACYALRYLKIPATLTTISSNAFGETGTKLYTSLQAAPSGWTESWSAGCTVIWGVETLYVDGNGLVFALYEDKTAILVGDDGTTAELVITPPTGYTLTAIAEGAFRDHTELISVTVPAGVSTIGNNTFYNCINLKNVSLPEGIRSIGENAFYACGLTAIDLPQSLQTIGSMAFHNCSALKSITIPSSVSKIGSSAFAYCSSLQSVTFAGVGLSVLETRVFEGCNGLQSITLPEGLTKIDFAAFLQCKNLKTVSLPSTLQSIGECAFEYCEALQVLVLPEGLTELGNAAFNACLSLEKVSLPSTLQTIPESAFNSCGFLTEVIIADGLKSIKSYAFANCHNLRQIFIPQSVVSVADTSFEGDGALTIYTGHANRPAAWNTNLQNTVSSIVWNVAGFQTDAQGVTFILSKNGTAVAVGYSGSATELTLTAPEGYTLTEIGDNCFRDNQSLTKVILPTGLTKIGKYAFRGCTALQSIELPETLTSIGANAFESCSALTSIKLPEGLSTVEEMTFWGCSKLSAITLPSTLTAIKSHAFHGVNVPLLYVPLGVTEFGDYAINSNQYTLIYAAATSQPAGWNANWNAYGHTVTWGVYGVTMDTQGVIYRLYEDGTATVAAYSGNASTVTIGLNGYTVTEILKEVFRDKESLTSIVIPEGVTKIGSYAFLNCRNLASVTLPNSLTTIEEYAFSSCTALRVFLIPKNVSQMSGYVFCECQNLYLFAQADNAPGKWVSMWNNQNFSVTWGVDSYYVDEAQGLYYATYSDGTAALIKSIGIAESPTLSVPNYTLTRIGSYAFDSNSALEEIVIPEGVISIEGRAFINCYELNSVALPSSLTSIGDNVFESCLSLSTINIPAGVTKMGDYVFSGTEILIVIANAEAQPSSWSEIWKSGAMDIFVAWGADGLYVDEEQDLYYATSDDGTANLIKYLGNANTVTISIPNYTLTKINDYAFSNKALTSIVIPEGVTEIGAYAFHCCNELKSITLPSTLTTIRTYAISYCPVLTALVIPKNVTVLDEYAVIGCDNLLVIAEAQTKPDGWQNNWDNYAATVVWNANGAYVDETQKLVYALRADGTAVLGKYYGNLQTLNLSIPNYSITELHANLFNGHSELTSITLPDTLTVIGAYAFNGCSGLDSITLPSGLLSIREHAFNECSGLTTLRIPASVTTVGYGITSDCYSLEKIYAEAPQRPDGWDIDWNLGRTVVWNYKGTYIDAQGIEYLLQTDGTAKVIGYHPPADAGSSIALVFPATVEGYPLTTIGREIFQSNTSITSISLPEGLTTIEAYAFNQCTGLTEVTIPASVTSIGTHAFAYCQLTNIYAKSESQPAGWDSNWYYDSYDVPQANIYFYYDGLYTDAQGVTYILHPNKTATVYSYNGNATVLSFAVDGYTVAKIASAATGSNGIFYNHTELLTVTLPEGLTEIGDFAFYNCSSLISVSFPSTLKSIGNYAFYSCGNLNKIDLPEGLISIGSNAFRECYKINEIKLPSTLTSIGTYAFYGTNATSIFIPASVTELASDALHAGFTLIYVEHASKPDGWDSSWCGWSQTVIWNVQKTVTDTQGVTYVIFTDNTATVTAYNGTATELTLGLNGYTVTKIESNVFYSRSELTKVVLPAGLLEIGSDAFSYCSGLTEINLPEGLMTIGYNAFYGCTSLSSVRIPSSVVAIGGAAFGNTASEFTIYATHASKPDAWDFDYGYHVIWNFKDYYTDEQGIEYILYNDNTAEVLSYNGNAESLTIAIDGYTVTVIRDNVFFGHTELKSVSLAAGLKKIGCSAFYGCMRLESIDIPSTVTEIEANAFQDCARLKNIDLPANLTYIGAHAFAKCEYLESITIPEGIDQISMYTFVNCIALTNVTFRGSITEICNSAFEGCTSLTEITLPDGLTTLGGSAFWGCTQLKTVSLPSSLTTIHGSCFQGCTALKNIELPAGLTTLGGSTFYECSSLESMTIPTGITEIEGYLFNGCTNLKSLSLHNNITRIGDYAFANCNAMQTLEIPTGLKRIESWAFYQCTKLSYVLLPESLTYVGSYAFYDCFKLTIYSQSLIQPSAWDNSWNPSNCSVIWDVKQVIIGEDSVVYVVTNEKETEAIVTGYNGTATEVTVKGPTGLTVIAIGAKAFHQREDLISVLLPSTVTSIGAHAFSGCINLTTVNLPDSVTSIGEHAFNNCQKLTDVTLPRELSSLGEYAFADCDALTELSIPSKLTVIPDYAFSSCGGFTKIVIPEGVIAIGNRAFHNCHTATLIYLPASLQTIGEHAFADCYNVTEIFLPETVTTIREYAFTNCHNATIYTPMAEANVPSTWHAYWNPTCSVQWESKITVDEQGVIYRIYDNTQTAEVIRYVGNGGALTIGLDGYTVIGIRSVAFMQNQSITSIVLPEGLTTLCEGVFQYCLGLKSVTLPSTLQEIQSCAFQGCTALEEIFIPASVTTIHYGAFGDCPNLIINAEISEAPLTWNDGWNYSGATVNYGQTKPEEN